LGRELESGRQLLTYLDTHIALWLATGTVALSVAALCEIDTAELRISPIVVLEMEFLQETGRVLADPEEFLTILRRDFEVNICSLPFHEVIQASRAEKWTRDPFDRIIVGQARTAGAKLITRDRSMRENFPAAIW
jgi:PIN domain nuclease of toxin-antitoxin system